MAGIGAGYDLSVSTFSPDGKVFQVEYATNAVENSGATMGFCCKDGLVLGTEKVIFNKMVVAGSSRRVFAVDKHASIVVAGFVADGRQIVDQAREEAKNYKYHYGENIPAKVLAERVALFVHTYTLYWSVRPFGASVLIGVYDKENAEPQIYCVEPSGTCYEYSGYALGKGRQLAKTELEKLKMKEMSAGDAVYHLARIIRQVRDENKSKDMEIEMSWISEQSGYQHQIVPREIVKQAETRAQAYLDALEQD